MLWLWTAQPLSGLIKGFEILNVFLSRLIQNKLYVNQARVIFTYETKSSSGKKQFLYLIGIEILISEKKFDIYFLDSVLEPLVPKGNKIEDFVDIKAGNILRRSDSFRF